MRTFEIILLLIVTLLPFVKRPVLRRVQANHVLIFLGVLFALHLVIEGWRWQMIPAYILVLLVAWRIKAIDTTEPTRLNFLRGAGFLGISILAFVGWVLPMALPVFNLPEPKGSYKVGTEMVQVDTQMDELFTEDPNDKRELMLKVGYPSEADVSSLDGIQWGQKIDTTYAIPYLYVSADWPAEHEDINSHVYMKKSTDYFYEAKLLQSGHPNFMDIPFMILVQSLAGTGEIDPYEGTEIVTQLVTSFFDRHLKGMQDADPQKVANQYALLEMNVFKGDSIK